MALEPTTGAERLIKSVDRVRNLAEVFTPASTVQEMLDLLPDHMWDAHPSRTFLEPTCGDGNFLVAILNRKLDRICAQFRAETLSAGSNDEAVAFHALGALASIYAVDISRDNVIGGTPGHEVGARDRLIWLLIKRLADILRRPVDIEAAVIRSARWIVERNIQVGNMLPAGVKGAESKRDELPLREYSWGADDMTVTVTRTTFGTVMASEPAQSTNVLSLFGPPEPMLEWEGSALHLGEATNLTDRPATATAHGASS